MQTTLHRTGRAGDRGFTLIELLVVVVIIGVLVAIAVPVYLNYRKGAADKSAQSDVRGAVSTIEQYYTENNNKYPPASLLSLTTSTAIGGQRITLSDKTTLSLYVASASATSYLVCASNSGGTANKYYLYDSSSGGSVSGKTYATFDMTTCTGT